MPAQMVFTSVLTTEPGVEAAVEAVIIETQAQLTGLCLIDYGFKSG